MAASFLTGCASTTTPQMQTTPTPQLSEKAAYDLAYQAYDDFNKALNIFGTQREAGENLLRPLVNQEILTGLLEAHDIVDQRGHYVDGNAEFYNFQLQEFSDTHIIALTCVDTTNYRVRNAQHEDVTNPELPIKRPFIATWSVSGTQLTMEGVDEWSDLDMCS